MKFGLKFLFLFFAFVHDSLCQPQFDLDCLRYFDKVLVGFVPKGNKAAGKYTKAGTMLDIKSCTELCCKDKSCNVVFMYNTTCFKIECENDELCQPVMRQESKYGDHVKMVIVRPVSVEFQEDFSENGENEDMIAVGSETDSIKQCDLMEPETCGINEHCVPSQIAQTNVCECKDGFERNMDTICVALVRKNMTGLPNLPTSASVNLENVPKHVESIDAKESTPNPPKKIMVTVISKKVRLPDNEVKLSAYPVPAENPGKPYTYNWKLLSHPHGSEGTVSENQGATLKLSQLTEGLYVFKVSVTGTGAYGETEANVTVLPQKRENKPPVAIVLPAHQIVKLPNSRAVLDASSSKDDNGITKFHWELQQGPLGYQPNLSDTQTLQLKDLHKAGNYTFRLTLTDTDGATNSTLANITVLQVPDYPPEANAGPSVILYLPKNNVTLNGNLSSDDKGIVSWEWTKSSGEQDNAVDMQNTHTPYLQLSHLGEGMYTFTLKVTDDSGQSSSSDVRVFVKPPTNKPPIAHAGSNATIALPQTWTILNGSESTDDIGIDHWKWEQISGPRKAVFLSSNSSVTNVTGLTKGDYVFQLTVIDGNENSVSDRVTVSVTQNKNVPPKANAGGDQTLTLPIGVLIVNGSQSSDDLGIAKWQWTRELTSLAMGTIIDQSDTTPVLMVTNVVAGRYEFRLRVTDDQGEWAEDTVSIIIKQDPEILNLIELTLNIEASKLTQTQRDSVLLKLGMLLRDASQLVVRDLKPDTSNRAKLVFYVSSPSGSVPGPQVVHTLKNKLAQDSFLLQLSVVDIRTTVCQNNCSGHGVCDQETRVCFCESFWMQDMVRKYLGDGESNCDPLGKVVISDSDTDSDVLFENNRNSKSNGTKVSRNGYKPDRRVKVI
ncbi:dyslexia-associated protein KIAA0319-like protein isoform X2 [Cimex lectularius]|uniref:PKD domain-containing protein n=1 Tax=Cimex lectularius TaxID=79782 RepID=A0A8I6TKU6_CIMLE|nr:dyslexia-associated protein KIAA0319-like protein isoform X2 [Cimex lectularius]